MTAAACDDGNPAPPAPTNDMATTGTTGDMATTGPAGDMGGPAATFTQVYTMVIASSCAPCHTTAGGIGITQGQLDLTTQSKAYANLVNVAAAGTQCAGKGSRVVPGMPDSSILYLKVSLDDPAPCGAKMPLGGALTEDKAEMIESWIAAGAMNN